MANLSIFKDYLQAARSMPENDSLKDYQIYEDWAESYSAAGKDSALESSLDNASKLLYRGVQTVGDATGIDVISDFGKEGVKQQEQDLIDGGFTPEYPGTIRSNFNDGGIGQAISAAWEKTQENAALTGASLVGGGLAALTAPISLPAAAVITGTTLAGAGLMGVGEVASEMEEKGVEVNNLSALAGGAVIAALDKVGLSKLFPVGKLAGKGATEIASEAAKAGYKEQAKIFLKEVSKKIGVETATELGQEATSMGLASFEGAAYTLDDIIDRAIDTSVVATTMTSPFAVASTLKDMKGGGAKDQEPEAPPQETQPRKKRTLREMEDLLAGSTIEGVTADMDLKSEVAEQTSNAPAFSSDNILNQAPLEESPVRDSVLDEASSSIDALEEATNILPVDPTQTTDILPNIAANTQQSATKTPEPIPTVGVENNAPETTLKQHENTVELSKAKQAEVKIQAMMDRQPSILDAPAVQAQTEPAVSDIKKKIADKLSRAKILGASPNQELDAMAKELGLDIPAANEDNQASTVFAIMGAQDKNKAGVGLQERAAARKKLKFVDDSLTLNEATEGETTVAGLDSKPVNEKRRYNEGIEYFSGQLVEGGGVSYLTDEHGNIDGKTPSVNPDWFINGGFLVKNTKGTDYLAKSPSVKAVKRAVADYKSGKKITKNQHRILEALEDQYKFDRQDDIDTSETNRQDALADQSIDNLMDEGILTTDMLLTMSAEEVNQAIEEDYEQTKQEVSNGEILSDTKESENSGDQKEAGATQEESLLTDYSQDDLNTKADAEKQQAAESQSKDKKAEIDAGVDNFALTGSVRASDANAGQSDVFDAPKKQTSGDPSSETTKETEKVTPEEWTAPKTKIPLNELYLKDEAATKQVTHKGKSVQIRLNAQEKLDAINVRIEALEQVKRCLL